MHSLAPSEDTQNSPTRNLRDSIKEQTLASEKEGFETKSAFHMAHSPEQVIGRLWFSATFSIQRKCWTSSLVSANSRKTNMSVSQMCPFVHSKIFYILLFNFIQNTNYFIDSQGKKKVLSITL